MGYPWELRLRYFTRILLRPGFAVPDNFGHFRGTYSVASGVVFQGKKCRIRCKNPIFELEGSSLDQTKENYLNYMKLLQTHFLSDGGS